MNSKLLTIDEIERDFMVSRKTGFLIDCSKAPLPPCWCLYEEAADNLPELVEKGLLHRYVTEKLCEEALLMPKDKRQLLKLHTVLSFLTAGYVWQHGGESAAQRLPSCLAVPLVKVSDALGMKPVISYPSMMLSNWKILNEEGEFQVRNLVPIYTTPGGPGTDLFILTHVVVEHHFGPAIKSIIDAIEYTRGGGTYNDPLLIKALSVIPQAMNKMVVTLQKIKDGLPPNVYYDRLRIFYSGWGYGKLPLPNGLIYEGVHDSPLMMRGGSAAQSCTLQMLDAAFGIKHSGDEKKYLDEVRGYMLREHRDLYDYINDQSRLREYVEGSVNVAVRESYNGCISAIEGFRRHHITKANEYIKQPAQRPDRNSSVESIRYTGTGGAGYITFLNRIRRSTALAKLKPGHMNTTEQRSTSDSISSAHDKK